MESQTKAVWKDVYRAMRAGNSRGDFFPSMSREQRRAALANRIRQRQLPGRKVAVYVWQRDCDMAEWDQVIYIPASVVAFLSLEAHILDSAEGPVSMTVMGRKWLERFEPSCRDRVAEAWENGNRAPFLV